MKLLITGSSGYVGNVLAQHFAKKGVIVVGADIVPHRFQHDLGHFTFVQCDVRDQSAVRALFEKTHPTHVIHLAYLMDPAHDRSLEDDIDINGTKYVFTFANSTASVKKFIEMSSTSAYGARSNNPLWMTEEHPIEPIDYVYGINKKIIEEWMNEFPTRKDIHVVTFRMCSAVGEHYYKPGGVVSTFSRAPFAISIADEPQKVQFIHEEDLIALMEKVLADETIHGIYNLAPDSFATVADLAATQHKMVLRLPHWLFYCIIWLLWKFRLTSISPPIVRLMTHSIIASPKKIMDRYHYHFKYSTLEAFCDAVEKRRKNKTL